MRDENNCPEKQVKYYGLKYKKIVNPTIERIYNLFCYWKIVWICLYIKQLYSRYVYIAFRKNGHVSTEVQLTLNKFQRFKILCIQIKVIEKKKKIMLETETRMFIFSCAYATMK